MIQRLREAKNPSKESVQLIKLAADKIHPDDKKLLDWYNTYVKQQSRRLAFDIDYMKKFLPHSVCILEVGAIPLLLTIALKDLGYNVKGIDIVPERFSATITKHNLDIRKVDIETEALPYSDNIFDAVIFNEIFEHLRINPIFTMNNIRQVLKNDGMLFLSTPNFKSINGVTNFLFRDIAFSCAKDVYAEYSKLTLLGHMGHVREYTIREVMTFLEHVGFSIQTLILRGKVHSPLKIKHILITFYPVLRPFFSVIAKKRRQHNA